MSQAAPCEHKSEPSEAIKENPKCRIPQRLSTLPGRQRTSSIRPRATNIQEQQKSKQEVVAQQPRYGIRTVTRCRTDEQQRPKSAHRLKNEIMASGKPMQPAPRAIRTEREKPMTTFKRPSVIPKRVANNNLVQQNKNSRPVIMVPMTQKHLLAKSIHTTKNMSCLPDQETIKRREELEVRQGNLYDAGEMNDINEGEPISTKNDIIRQLLLRWQEKMVQYDQLRNDLGDRQRIIMDHYATMRSIHKKMCSLGHKLDLPNSEDLQLMNVSNLSPEQLLQLCAATSRPGDKTRNVDLVSFTQGEIINEELIESLNSSCLDNQLLSKGPFTIDLNKLYMMPTKLVATCEQTLIKRKEIIDWFEKLKKEDKGISISKLTLKINEFTAENEMLNCTLETVKADFYKELNDIVEVLRSGVNETMALQLRTEEMMYELSELNSKNNDLRKQIHNSDHLKSQSNRHKIEELEKELKEEKCKKCLIKDRLTRAEGQLKMKEEKTSNLEAALEQARSQAWTLEHTVQQLREQNQKLQTDFDKELSKLTESIRENTVHLEEIAESRLKLKAEKEDLEKRLNELSENYNESMNLMKEEINSNIAKLIATDKKYNEIKEEKDMVEKKVENLCAQLVDVELRYKDAIHDKDSLQCKNKEYLSELEKTKHELSEANSEIEDYMRKLKEQSESIKDIELEFGKALDAEKNLQGELSMKDEYIKELKIKLMVLEEQLHESETKMMSYESQLSTLKDHIHKLQRDFGEFENLSELHEMLNKQRSQLKEANQQNSELSEAYQEKNEENENLIKQIEKQRNLLEQKECDMKMLSEKEEEQLKIINLLKNNLEMRTQADINLNMQLNDQNAEIESLVTNLETRKLQISQLEKIILTLEDQTRKASIQRNKDQEKITLLENRLAEYESCQMENSGEVTADNLDNLMKMLEDELGTPFEQKLISKDEEKNNKREKKNSFEVINTCNLEVEHENVPTRIATANVPKKKIMQANGEKNIYNESLDRKKAIINMDTKNWLPAGPESNVNMYVCPASVKENFPVFNRVIPGVYYPRQVILQSQLRDEKKSKMFKLAGHKL